MIHHEQCIDRLHSDINVNRKRKAKMHMGAVLVMLIVKLVTIVRRVFHKFVCVVVVNGVSVGMLLVGHMCSLSHSDHQGVIENEQKCHDEFLVHAIDLSCQWVGTVSLWLKPSQTGLVPS